MLRSGVKRSAGPELVFDKQVSFGCSGCDWVLPIVHDPARPRADDLPYEVFQMKFADHVRNKHSEISKS